ncbi:hypothetical protein [Siphonobacter sp. SORGH_AS_1065]|uniref:hypothetical protein n=1 Tax=Siphonobacter sp. SORGH_AS_1065 TaxID=3041795 RepID=UPI002781072F|nr:hypothetical protein [Siphonobacter sp. SORGH_AS_1065]MDQ1088610.1 putative peroxiredoxin [Siphonobacter sp. SORGH_AS_1065]
MKTLPLSESSPGLKMAVASLGDFAKELKSAGKAVKVLIDTTPEDTEFILKLELHDPDEISSYSSDKPDVINVTQRI